MLIKSYIFGNILTELFEVNVPLDCPDRHNEAIRIVREQCTPRKSCLWNAYQDTGTLYLVERHSVKGTK